MSYQDQYRQKLVSAAQAAAVVKSGDWVDYSWTATTPRAVDKELAKRLPDLYDVNFYGGILRKCRCLDAAAGRTICREKFCVGLVHGREVGQVFQEDCGFHDVVHAGTSRLQDMFDIGQ